MRNTHAVGNKQNGRIKKTVTDTQDGFHRRAKNNNYSLEDNHRGRESERVDKR